MCELNNNNKERAGGKKKWRLLCSFKPPALIYGTEMLSVLAPDRDPWPSLKQLDFREFSFGTFKFVCFSQLRSAAFMLLCLKRLIGFQTTTHGHHRRQEK